jgi:hypothetical protein
MATAPAPPDWTTGDGAVEAAEGADSADRTTNPEEEEGEPWLDRRARRALQRVFSQALDRQAGQLRRRRHGRPKHYSGQREPVPVARHRHQQEDKVDT